MIRISGRARVLSLVITASLAGLGVTGASQPAHASPATAAIHQPPTTTRAQAAAELSRAESLFGGSRAASRLAQRHEDATLLLRDLRAAYPALSPDQRTQADRILARPGPSDSDPDFPVVYTGTEHEECSTRLPLCVHYDLSTEDSTNGVDPTDGGDTNKDPDYVDEVLATMEHVWDTYAAAGYRMPLVDSASADNGSLGGMNADQTDIYLGELSRYHLYGFCTSDDPALNTGYAGSAYCVLDNDYAPAQYPGHTQLENLEVTAAHEFFHAVQFSYDFFEDPWIMEATATWAEDELYTSINDNMQYLSYGADPIRNPSLPLDTNGDVNLHWYGTWIFFRFLTERLVTEKSGALPLLIRQIWQRLDASPGAPDMYSIKGVRSALAAHHIDLTRALSRFDLAARHPTRYFSEAAANQYPSAPVATSSSVGPGHLSWSTSFRLLHLSYRVLRLTPKAGTGSAWHLRLHLDLPAKTRGAAATLWINAASGGTSSRLIALSSTGDATIRIPFGSATVRNVEVEVVNASPRFSTCWNGYSSATYYSCYAQHGTDDNLPNAVRATAYRS
ncbi:MXAN_6640 family putative metalloprotease [Nocardioides ultimimeridianus]